ncbi:lipid-A-disaccharide synthase N-terminal domain-containing protein [Dyella ginsengisoli]
MRLADGLLEPLLGPLVPWLYRDSMIWTGLGLAGAALFSSRFLIQWLHSEKARQLVVPPIFWHLSFWGSVLQLLYALHIDKLPVMLSYAFLPFLYARNLWLLKRTALR